MATFLFAYLFIVSNLKFVKGFQEYYAASSGTLVQNSSCIVDNEVLHPCATLDVFVSDYTFSSATGNGNISIYLIHDRYFVFKNLSLCFSNLNVVEILPWRKLTVWVTSLSSMLMSLPIVDIALYKYCAI